MPAELIAADGTVAGYQQHTLWGGTLWRSGGAATPLRFPGQYHDPETGLHYNQQRYYDPVTGSYLTPDPLGLAPAPNPHAYVPNPLTQIDPLGLMSCGPEGNATKDAVYPRGLGTDLPTWIYSARVLIRMADGDTYHNFPESFNQAVFDLGARSTVAEYFTKPVSLLSNDSVNYTLSGSINGVDGEYQIFTRPSVSRRVELIMHRFFMPH